MKFGINFFITFKSVKYFQYKTNRTLKSQILIPILFLLNLSIAQSQSIDSLLMFTNNNEGLFWNILSKNYAFSHDEITKYEENINFYYLSGNENIEWSSDFIRKYEDKLSKKYELQRNKGINWSEELISEFIDREWLDWSQLYYNRELKISNELYEEQKDNFITTKFIIATDIDSIAFKYTNPYTIEERRFENYLKNWYSESDSLRVKNYQLLKPFIGKELSTISIDTLAKYHDDLNWLNLTPYANLNWTWETFIKLYPKLEKRYIPNNEKLFQILIKPKLDSLKIDSLTNSFSNKTRYYELKAGEDKYGSLPEVKVSHSSKSEYYVKDMFNFSDTFPETIKDYNFQLGHSAEGPKRFSDVLFLDNDYGFTGFTCTERVKSILENYNLPNHAFYPIEITLNSAWYGTDTLPYYLFVTNNRSVLQKLRPSSIVLSNSNELFNETECFLSDSLDVRDREDYLDFINPKYKYKHYKYCNLNEIEFESHYDILTTDNYKLYFSKRLTKSLDSLSVMGIRLVKDYDVNWKMLVPEIEIQLKKKNEDFVDVIKSQRTIRLFEDADKRKQKIEANFNHVREYYRKNKISKLNEQEKKLAEKEIEWNVIIPDEYKKYLLSKERPNLGREFNEYEFFEIDEIEQVTKDWYKNIPQTYRALLIAGNGLGDYLGLLIEENSEFKLSNTVYKFEHEIGELIKSIKIE